MGRKKYFGNCSYCGNKGKLTKEHIFPNWLGDCFEKNMPNRIEMTIKQYEGKFHFSPTKTSGAIHTKKYPIACSVCNNGWMSQIVEAAKPIQLKIINGEAETILSNDELITLRNDICITILNIDKIDKTKAIDDRYRKAFKENGSLEFLDYLCFFYMDTNKILEPNKDSQTLRLRYDNHQYHPFQFKSVVYSFGGIGIYAILKSTHISLKSELTPFFNSGIELYPNINLDGARDLSANKHPLSVKEISYSTLLEAANSVRDKIGIGLYNAQTAVSNNTH